MLAVLWRRFRSPLIREEVFTTPFQLEQISFCIEATRKARELAGMADDAMARHKNRNGVSTICRAYRPRGLWVAELDCKLAVRAGLPERYVEQRFPDLPLKGRSPHIERHRKTGSHAGEVFVQFFLCSNEHRMFDALNKFREANPSWVVVSPKNADETSIARDQLESPDGRGQNLYDRFADRFL